MKNIRQYVPLVLVLILITVRYLAYWCVNATSCSAAGFFWPIFFSLIKPAYLFSLAIIIVAIVLLFVRKEIFSSWLRFAIYGIPISIILIGITPVDSTSAMPLYFVGKEDIAWQLGIAFTTISLILIAWKSFATRKYQLSNDVH